MSALTALPAIASETMQPDRPRATERGFAHEMEHAQKRDPVKKADQPKQRKPDASDDGDQTPPPPDAQMQKDQAAPQATGAPAAAKAEGVNSVIGQSVADAARDVATAMQQGTAVAGTSAGDPAVQSILTPLEQAVHDLIDQVRSASHDESAKPDIPVPPAPGVAAAAQAAPDEPHATARADQPAPMRELPAEPPVAANPSHVHLVLDEAERLVVTVAVRGDSVIASVRGGDEHTAAALARNAGSLDHAMRARGLQLADFQAQRDDHHTSERQSQQRDRSAKQPKFTLEDLQ